MVFFGISSTLIDAHTLPGQTEGFKVGCGGMGGWVGCGGMGGRRDGWIGGKREKVRGVYGLDSLI